jgi:hypothetical protein
MVLCHKMYCLQQPPKTMTINVCLVGRGEGIQE